MKLTPLDIKQKKFKKGFRGYDTEDVELFLEAVSSEFERIFHEHRGMTEQVNRLNDQLKEYIESERILKRTLISATETSGNIKETANKKADLIVREAELSAERLVESARNEVRELNKEIEKLKKEKSNLKYDLLSVLDNYYEALEMNQEDIRNSVNSMREMNSRKNRPVRPGIKKNERMAENNPAGG